MTDEIRFVGELQKLELGPEDVLVLHVNDWLSKDARENIKKAFAIALPDRRVMILERGMKLGAIKAP